MRDRADRGEICHGTMDTWIIYKLTGGASYKTDYSNASRTQLFNIFDLKWDGEICGLFGIRPENMAEVCDSDAEFGETDFEGVLPHPVPIHAVLGDSHGALFGQGCVKPGMVKETYGTEVKKLAGLGFSAMMHGYMAFDKDGQLLVPFRTWRNTITGQAADELTELFQYNIPQRWSIAHLYQAILNGEEHVKDVAYFTTLAGYIHWQLTGRNRSHDQPGVTELGERCAYPYLSG